MTVKTREQRRAELLEYSARWPDDPSRSMQHMLDLDDEFPAVEIFGPQCISAEVGPGWKQLLRPVMQALSENGCKAGQIKEKFGALRFYWDFPDAIEDAQREWRARWTTGTGMGVDAPPMPLIDECDRLRSLIDPVVETAELLSDRTCSACGGSKPEGAPACADCRSRRGRVGW